MLYPTKQHRGHLRGIHYETAGLTLLNEIDEVLLAGGFPRFVAWTTSRIGAFYLPNHYSGQDEVRLLHKHFTGATDLRKRDGSNHYWPLPLNVANEVATAELISIEAGPNADRARIEKAVRSSRLKCQSAGKRGPRIRPKRTPSIRAFDLLEIDGYDVRNEPLLQRKSKLKKLLNRKGRDGLQYVDHLEGDGAAIFEHACRMGLEGIVSKRADSPYRTGRSKVWLKIKNRRRPALMRVAESFER
jgi:hypothetical protein